MLEVLTRGFQDVRAHLQGFRSLNEENLAEALRMIRVSLLEADVEFQVARDFLDRVKEKALGELVLTQVKHRDKKMKVSPGDHFIHLCHKELVDLMGPSESGLSLRHKPVSSVMLVGLQGSGKTTTAGKLARFLEKKGRKPMLVAADIYRPAAVDQLKKLGEDLGIPVYSNGSQSPPEICANALQEAWKQGRDVAIFDTAGRLTVDENLMEELNHIQQQTRPENVLLVCDAMIGQESVNVAKAFNERIQLSGFILTKLDGDARGGAAVSIRESTGVPIKFVGMGEGMDRLEEFRPEGLASRILGFGDVVGLVQDFEEVVDEKKAEEDAMRMLQGNFDFNDFLSQLKTLKKVGPMRDVMEKLPMFPGGLPDGADMADDELKRMESIISSMTLQERRAPALIDDSRRRRIAKGSGRSEADVRDCLTKFNAMKGLLGAMGGGKIPRMLRGMKGLKNLFSGGMGGAGGQMGAPGLGMGDPFGGMPDTGKGKVKSKKDKNKARKKGKQAKQARKKARKK